MNHHEEAKRLYNLEKSLGLKADFFGGLDSSCAAFYIGNTNPSFQCSKDDDEVWFYDDNFIGVEKRNEYFSITEAEQRIRKLAESQQPK